MTHFDVVLFRRAWLCLALLLCAGAAWGQEWRPPQPGPLCGQRISTPQTSDIAVGCLDFDALARLGVPGVFGQRMQVFVKAKYWDAVRIEAYYIDAEGREASIIQWGDLRRNQAGDLVALIQFEGWHYTRIVVKVYRE